MRWKICTLLVVVVVALEPTMLRRVAMASAPGAGPEIVQTIHGAVSGVALSGDITVFKGIRYAQPPTGELRWKPPVPVRSGRNIPLRIWYGLHSTLVAVREHLLRPAGAHERGLPVPQRLEAISRDTSSGDGLDTRGRLAGGSDRRPVSMMAANWRVKAWLS